MQVINTLEDGLKEIAKYAGGTVPQKSDDQYAEWVSWLNAGQEDAAERGFWSRLLTKADLETVTDEDTALLPDDFHKRNGIYALGVDDIDWAEANNSVSQRLFVNINEDGEWVVYFRGFTPTEDKTGELWYFRHPAILVEPTDVFVLDGKMCVYYALTEYFRQAGELGSLDDARAEYNNRFEESLGLEMLPSPQELLAWKPYFKQAGFKTSDESRFYRRGRNRGRA